jgi:predicted AlkP superfamily pyrophosphatase or phosphodiesterase
MLKKCLQLMLGAALLALPQQRPDQVEKKARPAVPLQPALTARVVLVSIPGLGADFVGDAMEKGASIPNITRAREEGAASLMLEGVYPSLIAPAHATILTGMLPADHGIVSDHRFDEVSGSTVNTDEWKLTDIKSETILQIAARAGISIESRGFPFLGESSSLSDAGTAIEFHTFHELDTAQVRYGPESREAIAALEEVDRKLAVILERAKGKAAVLILSDSGRETIEREFRPNVILARKKFLSATSDGKIAAWRAVCQSFGGSAGVRVKDQADEKLIAEIEKTFQEVHEKSDSPIGRLIDKKTATRLGSDPRIAFYIDAAPQYVFSERADGDTRGDTRIKGAAGHLPQRSSLRGILIAWGTGIKPRVRLEYARLVDIAPTVARLLGLELKTARGRVLNEVLDQ